MNPLFEIKNLFVEYTSQYEKICAVHNVSLSGVRGQTVGIVGESGSGKSTLAKALLMLEPPVSGSIYFDGQEITKLSSSELRKLRRHIQPIFQDPDSSLNQRRTAGWHLDEVLTTHFQEFTRSQREEKILSTLSSVQLDSSLLHRFPFELSGGQKQRLAIARALLLEPKLLVLDEPLSSLDAALRKSVLSLLQDLQKQHNMGYLFITHDLSTLAAIANWVAVMYRGTIVEFAPTQALYQHPGHPYTIALLSCIPIPDPERERKRLSLFFPPQCAPAPIGIGCPFAHRCPLATPTCHSTPPSPIAISEGRTVSCHRVGDVASLGS